MRRLCLILLLCALPAFHVFAQSTAENPLAKCGHDPVALATAIEANGWVFDDLIQLNWSPNCHYLSLRLPSSHGNPGTTIVWNADANQQVGTIVGYASGNAETEWDTSGDYLIVPSNNVGTYLWYVPANRQMLITTNECGLIDTDWNYEQHRLHAASPIEWTDNWCSPFIEVGGLSVYDLDTGATIANYPTTGYTFSYEYTDEGRYLKITNYPGSVQVYDVATGEQLP